MYDTIYQTDNNMEKSFLNDINNKLKKNKTKSTVRIKYEKYGMNQL